MAIQIAPHTKAVEPEYVRKETPPYERLSEPTVYSLEEGLSGIQELQHELMRIPTHYKLAALDAVGDLWTNPSYPRKENVANTLIQIAGFPYPLAMFEADMIANLFDGEYFGKHLNTWLGDRRVIDHRLPIAHREYRRFMPYNGVFLIGSANSVLPLTVNSLLSWLANNFQVVRPSRANYAAFREITESFEDAVSREQNSNVREALKSFGRGTIVCYMSSDSDVLSYMLGRSPIRTINFIGEEATLQEIRPRIGGDKTLIPNLSYTGAVVVEEGYADNAIRPVSVEIATYLQKLCSSPTVAVWVGSQEGASGFARRLVDLTASEIRQIFEFPPDYSFQLQMLRRSLMDEGLEVVTPTDNSPEATVVISNNKNIDSCLGSGKLHMGRRPPGVLEMVVVPTIEEAPKVIRGLKERSTYKGIVGVQTVGYSVSPENRDRLITSLEQAGVFRIVPLEVDSVLGGRMFVRSSLEPLGEDGRSLVVDLGYWVYSSDPL